MVFQTALATVVGLPFLAKGVSDSRRHPLGGAVIQVGRQVTYIHLPPHQFSFDDITKCTVKLHV